MDLITIGTLLLLIFFRITNGHGGGDWGYRSGMKFLSPNRWNEIKGSSCGGKRQSPINIEKKESVYWNELKPVIITKGENAATVKLESNATSLYLGFSNMWNMSFGGEGCFRPISMHWHWGSKDQMGSEHTFDGIQYAMEAHLVTYNCQLYEDADTAIKSASGLYAFAILYKIGEMNPALASILPHMDIVINNKETMITEIKPETFLPTDRFRYYRYEGSLTTPPCTENVIWTVFNEVQTVSENQVLKFRSLQFRAPESGPMVDNFRPVIALQPSTEYVKRIVYTSFNRGFTNFINSHIVTLLLILSCTIII